MDISKDEMRRTMRRHKGIAWDQSPVFKRIYEEEYGQLGGEPYGCLVADYYFDHTPADVELLGAIAKISAASHAPFIAGSAPSLLGMESWQELANPRDLAKITSNLEHAPWTALRNTEDARYVGLAMPRFLARLPYGVRTNPVDEFDFEEQTEGADHKNYVWNNAAYAMAVNINRSFKQYGWCTMIRGVESGGTVENLPCHTFPTDDGGFDMKCPTEIAISDRREAELAKAGLIPLVHRKNTDHASFIGAQSLQKPQEYVDADATANANLSARLPYLFASTRFAHYLMRALVASLWTFDPAWSEDKHPVIAKVREQQATYDRYVAQTRAGSTAAVHGVPQPPTAMQKKQVDQANATRYREIYIHSKLMIIDDSMFTLGSANLNLRSFAVDSEINIASDDAETAKNLRKRVWAQHTGDQFAGGVATEQSVMFDTFTKWKEEARENLQKKQRGEPLTCFLTAFHDDRTSSTRLS
jgi:endonuclease YncB( thermonuclease family)